MAIIKMRSKWSLQRGIHRKFGKYTKNSICAPLDLPALVKISLLQHIGAECTPLVEKGDIVYVGQKIGECTDGLSAPVHSSVAGIVNGIGSYNDAQGTAIRTVNIVSFGEQSRSPDIKPPTVTNRAELIQAAYDCGLVGLGGAGFPTHRKLDFKPEHNIDTLIINAAECEPYITTDYREMLEYSDDIAKGIVLIKELLGIQRAYIGIEDNKPAAIKLLDRKSEGKFDVISLPAVYPQGAEKMLIFTAAERLIPEDKLPLDVGVLVLNVTTVSVLYKYIQTGMPLTHRRITIDGKGITRPKNLIVTKNLIVPIGTPIIDILKACGAEIDDRGPLNIKKVVVGGPMMGTSIFDLSTPTVKTTSAITCFGKKKAVFVDTTACIRCGKCVRACPINLMPITLERAYDAKNLEDLEKWKVNMCINCGCCSFMCPAGRNLAAKFQLAKKLLKGR
ncbi:MAG: electron transport complex subunit RsxC [Oscillospiraceae bacterium]|nr:electron transport complex subunit RsxC [Oscillospiraceae bacterium]